MARIRHPRRLAALAARRKAAALAAACLALGALPAGAHHHVEARSQAVGPVQDGTEPMRTAALGPVRAERPRVLAPLDLEDHQGYNADYLFGMTRGVAGSTLHSAVKPLLMVITIPLDVALLPFAAIGGLFG